MTRQKKAQSRSDYRLTVCLPKALRTRLREVAEADDDKPSTWVRKLIKRELGAQAA